MIFFMVLVETDFYFFKQIFRNVMTGWGDIDGLAARLFHSHSGEKSMPIEMGRLK